MADNSEGDRWTVRGVSPEVRRKATAAAGRRDEAMGEWVSRVLSDAADREAGDTVIPPGGHGRPDGGRAPEAGRRQTGIALRQPDLADVNAYLQTVGALQAAGFPLTPGAVRQANLAVTAGARISRGLPVLGVGQTRRRTAADGLMIDAE